MADKPALARVTIFEIAERPWGWLTTSAEVDDRIYVGLREWRRQQKLGSHLPDPGSHLPIPGNGAGSKAD